ncbi:MAG: cell division protein FtsL [Clostridiaceae bacterium]|nr:cell division protein FtsL [Clostridiaceae bacterium]
MVVKEFEYVKGNVVTSPKRDEQQERKRQEEQKRAKRQKERKKFEEIRQTRKSVLQIATLIFVIGLVIITRDSKVYNMQKEISKIDDQISAVKDENEALKVELLKVSSLNTIQENAEAKLGMEIATKDNTIKIEIPKSYYDYVEKADLNKTQMKSKN